MANDHSAGTSADNCFRVPQKAMLIYMGEAFSYERTVQLTQQRRILEALRRRAKVDEDYKQDITATKMSEEAKGDFGAYSHGQLIDATLYNIRRERRNELCAEALRWEDLKRWRASRPLISKPYPCEGMLLLGK